MAAVFIKIVYHHGGQLVRNRAGVLQYAGGRVDEVPPMDVDYVNVKDLHTLCKEFGYEECRTMMWLEPNQKNLDVGLRTLIDDRDINSMTQAAVQGGNEIHLYCDGCIVRPVFAEEDIVGEEEDIDGEEEDSEGEEDSEVDSEGEEEDSEYEGNDSSESDDEEVNANYKKKEKVVGKGKRKEKAVGKGKRKDKVVGQQTYEDPSEYEEANMSFEDEGYGYKSEELKTPESSDGEGTSRSVLPKFNETAEWGSVHLELGMEFDSLVKFKKAVKDYNIALGRQINFVKNDKQRVRAKCNNDECDWEIYCAWNTKNNTFQIKTFFHVHTCCRLFQNKRARRQWVADKLEHRLLNQPNMTRAQAYNHMKETYNIHLHLRLVGKALHIAKEKHNLP